MSCKENDLLSLNMLQWIGIEYDFIDKVCSKTSKNAILAMEDIDIIKANNLLSSEIFIFESKLFLKLRMEEFE